MKKVCCIAFVLFTAGCGPSQSNGTPTTQVQNQGDSYADAKAKADAADAARESAKNDQIFNGLKNSGMSDKDAANVITETRKLCPHTDADGKCN